VIPYRTDAPIYHFPWATIGLIAVNAAAFIALFGGAIEDPDDWILIYGDGLHPLQWLTSNFIHGGLMHLAGNMFYLWGFGLVVEGKLGWWKFLLVYFGIGVGECAIEQTVMLGTDEGGSFGASAIVFGVLAIALVWAPENEVSVLWFRGTFDISIRVFSLFYIGWEALTVFVTGFAIGSSLLHLMGAAFGFMIGTILLKAGWVDCEGWDLFTRRRGRSAKTEPTSKPAPSVQRPAVVWNAEKIGAAIDRMRSHIQAGQTRAAVSVYEQIAPHASSRQLGEIDLLALIKSMHDSKLWNESVPVMVQFLRWFPQNDMRVRIRLAQVLIREQKRPGQALRVLAKIQPGSLPDQIEQVRQKLEAQAARMRDEGALELQTEDW
jgi:membrane associated rhomboid family serine protease